VAKTKRGPFISTARAKKTPGKTVSPGGTQIIQPQRKGQKQIAFTKGGLHESLGVPQGQPIPAGKKAAALAGKYGPKAKKQATLAFKGALAAGRATARKGKKAR
jgi:hypothetical protein